MDIDPKRLDLVAKLGERMVSLSGKKFEIFPTLDRHEALANATYVIVTIQVGGLEAYKMDIEIPAKYGVEQCVGDTLGPGGIFRALRTIPVLLDIAADMKRICPDAYYIDYSNPMAMNIWALSRESDLKVFGLCHSIPKTAERLAGFIDADLNEVTFLAAGINHMAWFVRFESNGADAYPLLKEKMKDPETYGMDPTRLDLFDHFGYFVSESSGHASEYYPYFRKKYRYDKQVCQDLHDPGCFLARVGPHRGLPATHATTKGRNRRQMD